MFDDGAALEVGFAIDFADAFTQLAQLNNVIDGATAQALRDFSKVEAASKGLLDLGGATASVTSFGAAVTRTEQQATQSLKRIENTGEGLIRQLDRLNSTFGMTTDQVRAMKVADAAAAAEKAGLTDVAQRLQAGLAQLTTKQLAAAQATEQQAQAEREAAQAYQLFEAAARRGVEAMREAEAAAKAVAVERQAAELREAAFAYQMFEAAARKGAAAMREADAAAKAVAIEQQATQLREAAFAYQMFEAAARKGAAAMREADAAAKATSLQVEAAATKRLADEQARLTEMVRGSQAAQEADAAAAERLRERTDPLYAATKRLDAEIAESTRLYHAGATARAEYERQQEVLTGRMQALGQANEVAAVSMGKSNFALKQTAIQIPDIVQGLLTGQHPMTIFIQQGGQIAQIAAMAEGGIKGYAMQLAGLALRFAPVIVGAAALFAGLELVKSSLDDDAGLKKYAQGLGLTHDEMKKLKDVHVTFGDIIKGTWRAVAQDTALGDYVDRAKRLIADLRDHILTTMRVAGAGIYAGLVGGYRATLDKWREWPAAFADLIIQGVNRAIDGINWLARGVNQLLGKDVLGQIGHLQNAYAGAGKAVGQAYATEFAKAYQEANAGLAAVERSIIATSRERLATQANEISFDRRAREAAEAHRKALQEQAQAEREAQRAAEERAKHLQDLAQDWGREFTELGNRYEKFALPVDGTRDYANTLRDLGKLIDSTGFGAQMNKQLKDQAALWSDLGAHAQEAASNMERAFGRVGGAIGDVTKLLSTYGEQQQLINKAVLTGDKTPEQGRQKTLDLQLSTMIGLTDATKNLFSTHSKAYAAMEAAEKALTIVQLARTAVSVAAGAAQMFAEAGPAGFGLVAAMVAVMAGLGFRGGGGGSAKAPVTNSGTGTVLGDSSAQSASIKNAIDQLRSIDDATLTVSQGMLATLRSIDDNIGGLASLIVRTGNLDAATAGVKTGFNPAVSGNTILAAALGPAGALASKIPVLGDILGGIAGVISKLFGTKTKIVGNGIFADPQALGDILSGGFDAQTYADIQKKKKFFGLTTSTKYKTQYGDLDDDIQQQFGLILKGFDDAIAAAAGPLGIATDAVQGKLDSFVVSLGKIDLKGLSGDEVQEKLSAVFGAAGDDMAKAAIPGLDTFQKVGEGYLETLVRVASTVEQVDASFQQLGLSAKSMGVDVDMAIAGQFDSVSDYVSAANAYFGDFYSAAEQAAAKTAQLGRVFDSLGVSAPATMADFRNLVSAQDLTTAAGQKVYATLLQIAPAFADLKKGLDDTAVSAKSAADILSERQDIQRQIWQLLGDTASLRADELAQVDPLNRDLKLRLYALQDEQAATEAATKAAADAAAAEAALAGQRASLENQLLQLQGDTAEIRRRELAALDPTLRALQQQVYAQQDLQAATAASAQAASDAAAREKAVADERAGLMSQLWELTGNTAAIRAAQLASLDPSNRALQKQLYAIQDAQAAAKAAQDLADAWKSVGASIADEVNRIRNLTDANTGTSTFASLQGQFNAAIAAAGGGDQAAAKSLPDLSKALLDAAALAATSRQELARIEAQTAAALQLVAGRIGAGVAASGTATSAVLGTSANDDDPAAATAWWNAFASAASRSSSDAVSGDIAEEVRQLRVEVAALRADNNRGHAATAGNTGSIDRRLDAVTRASGGDRVAVVVPDAVRTRAAA